jgi:hypothetical protein
METFLFLYDKLMPKFVLTFYLHSDFKSRKIVGLSPDEVKEIFKFTLILPMLPFGGEPFVLSPAVKKCEG